MSWLEDFKYRIRIEKLKQMQRLDDNTYYGGNLGGVTITKKRKKPYWVSPRGAGNMTVMPGDPEMVFFAPIAAGAGIAASPAITSALGSAVSGINTIGDAVAATAAGQRLTSGLNFAANAIGSSKAWPWIDIGLTSAFGTHGIDKVASGDIHNVGDVVETGLDLLPLSQLARPVINTVGRVGSTIQRETNNLVRNLTGPDGKIFNSQVPFNENNYYRVVNGKEAFNDLINSGLVRGSRLFNRAPYFGSGKRLWIAPSRRNATIIEATPDTPVEWTTPFSEPTPSTPSKPVEYLKNPKQSDFKSGNFSEVIPWQNGSYQIPIEGFNFYRNYPLIGWRKVLLKTTQPREFPRGLISREPLIARGGYEVARYPGYLLKGLMGGSPLERQLSKNGTININLLNAYFNKASQLEREVANKVLTEKFAGLRVVDYNLFKKAVLDELIGSYNRVPLTEWADYGLNRLGIFDYRKKTIDDMLTKPSIEFEERYEIVPNLEGVVFYEKANPLKGPIKREEVQLWIDQTYNLNPFRLNTFTFESPRIQIGNNKHYDATTLGHSRTYTLPDEPNILHVIESLSDWGQSHVKMMSSVLAHQMAIEKALKSGNTNAFHAFINRFNSLLKDKLTKYERMALENINKEIESGLPYGFLNIEDLWTKKYEILKKAGNRSNIGILGLHLHDNYLQRQLQENLRYAAENGLTRMRYPTPETAAKIEGYLKNVLARTPEEEAEMLNLFKEEMTLRSENPNSPRLKEISDRMNEIGNGTKRIYPSEHQTILRKYADFPKLFLKLYKGHPVKTVTDAKGNTWYEIDVPENYLNMEWQFKKGGQLISRNIITRFKK